MYVATFCRSTCYKAYIYFWQMVALDKWNKHQFRLVGGVQNFKAHVQ